MIIALRMRNNRANNNSFMYKTKDIKKLLQIINFLIEFAALSIKFQNGIQIDRTSSAFAGLFVCVKMIADNFNVYHYKIPLN